MGIPDSREVKLWETLDRVRKSMRLDRKGFADVLGMTHQQYESSWLKKKSLSVLEISRLLDSIPISFENLLKGKVDFKALDRQFVSGVSVLPERYSVGAFSRRRTCINLLAYLEKNYGENFTGDCLRQLQTPVDLFDDPDAMINIRFQSDLCEYLSRAGCQSSEFFKMGEYSVRTNAKSIIAKELSKQPTPRAMYEYLFTTLIGLYDENAFYKIIEITDTHLLAEVRPNPQVADALGSKVFGNPFVCGTRAGVGASFPAYMSLPKAEVKEIRCIHCGDPSCIYELDFSHAAFLNASRSSLAMTSL